MGDRGQVKLVEGGDAIFLYTHWGAADLLSDVANALERGRERWDDPEYLNRIIFSEMIQDDVMDLTGYGIGSHQHDDVWRVVTINHNINKVMVECFKFLYFPCCC